MLFLTAYLLMENIFFRFFLALLMMNILLALYVFQIV